MGKLTLDIIEDHDRNKLAAAGNHLSILLGADRVAYLISTPDHQTLAVREYERESTAPAGNSILSFLEKIQAEDRYLSQAFAQVRIGWTNPYSVIVPRRLYDPAHRAAYLEYLTTAEKRWEYGEDQLQQFDAWNVYATEGEALAWCRMQFPQSEMVHAATAFLNTASRQLATQSGDKHFFLHTCAGELRLMLLDKSRLYFSNAYTYRTAKDYLYYVLAVAEEFGLDQETTPVWLSGQLVEDSEIYRLIYRYFRKLSFAAWPTKLLPGPKLKAQPQHFYTDLYALALHTR